MILTDAQYEITQGWAARFRRALEDVRREIAVGDDSQQKLRRIYEAAFLRQLESLDSQLRDYDALRSGEAVVIKIESLAELPQALVKGRIAAGLTQSELAARVGIEEAALRHNEENEYEAVNLALLIEVAHALHLTIGSEVLVPARSTAAA